MNTQTKIIVRSTAVNERHITTRDGRQMTFREQSAALDNGQDFPQPFKLNLEQDQPAYKAGEYTLDPSSLYVDGKYGKLAIGRPKLILITASAARTAA